MVSITFGKFGWGPCTSSLWLGVGQKCPKKCLKMSSWSINPIDLKHGTKVYTNKNFLKMHKRVCPLSKFCWRQHFFYGNDQFSRKARFFKIFALIWKKNCFWGVYNDKSNDLQVLESNHIDSNCLYSQKRLIFQKSLLLIQ